MKQHDVIVAGAGIIGCSVAWQLSRLGKKVLLIERKDVASGSAGATDGVVSCHTKKPGPQLDLAVASMEMFPSLSRELGTDVEYCRGCGGMEPAEDQEQMEMLAAMAEEQRRSGADVRMLTREETLTLEPNLSPDIAGALYAPGGGKVNPLQLTFGYFRAAKRLGAEFLGNTAVTGFLTEGGRCCGVCTDAGEFRAEAVVNACGSWAGEAAKLAGLDIPIKPRKGQLAVTEPVGPFIKATVQCARYNLIKFRPEAVRDPAVLRLGSSLSIEQQENGSIIIGGTREQAGFEDGNTFEAVETMLRRALRFFPGLKDVNIVRFFSGFRPSTPDGLCILGEVSALPGFFMAAGHEGDGIALSAVTGKAVAELIALGRSSWDLAPFSPDRFASR